MLKKSVLADGVLLLVAFVWGTTFVLVQNAISFLHPFSFNGIRFLIAGLFLLLFILLYKLKLLKEIDRSLLISGMVLGIWLFLGYAFQTFGLLYTTSSKAGFITGLSVVLVPLFAVFLTKSKLTRNGIIGALVATVGLYMLTIGDRISMNNGDVLVFFCAISFAMHIILTGKYTNRYSSLLLTVIQVFTVSILSLLLAFLFEDWESQLQFNILFKNEVFIALGITSIFATALAFLAQTTFQKSTTPTRVALIFATEPVFAALAGYLWANEQLSHIAIIGCICIFVGMICSELPQKKKNVGILDKVNI
ncbi:DMT family transporter [Chengkuizengella axinellae]|uniref:DMT family transporter n=1 Tax=Chengkuizengella axinellae TaxID=3064388 RepID=A0ABT9J2K9_9BACL|nr:DMT family transporter [Chengkuizengella sp. 2205SS18-9]MDP5275845.1 DMT family transporter [Chengkuizengella sp. 2205SS18-9]